METDFKEHVVHIMNFHSTWNSKTPEKIFRKFDGVTPYWIHPIWCATTIATEQNLSKELRDLGFLVLLYHDVLEDTIADESALQKVLGDEVVFHIKDMTFADSADEMKNIWTKDPKIKLFKLYDKVNNLINFDGWPKEKIQLYIDYAHLLADDVYSNFGRLNIHHIFDGIKEKYQS